MNTPRWADPFSPEGQREAVSKILTGRNYRLFFEGVTRHKLIDAYTELAAIAREHPHDDKLWRDAIIERITDTASGDVRRWLLGLTRKTAENLGIPTADYRTVFQDLMDDIQRWPSDLQPRETALLLWCGAATLTIRGSQKARIGKALERSMTVAALTVLGLVEGDDFWLGIRADAEVDRETDAEVSTPRGRMRMEIGLIGRGNPEVIGDKIGRMDRNGVILFDILNTNSAMWDTADHRGVKLIQLRNNHPVEELRQHLHQLGVNVRSDPLTINDVETATMAIDLHNFDTTRRHP